MEGKETLAFIKSLPCFAGVAQDEMSLLAAGSVQKRASRAEIVLHQGEQPDRLWFVQAGLLRVSLAASLGRSLTVDVRCPGEDLCYPGLISGAPCPFDVAAVVDSTVLGLPLRMSINILPKHPANYLKLIEDLSGRLVESQRMRAMAIEPSRRRVLWVLTWLQSKLGSELPMTRQDIAEATGVARETAVRVLSPLEKRGLLRTTRGLIEILRPETLRRL